MRNEKELQRQLLCHLLSSVLYFMKQSGMSVRQVEAALAESVGRIKVASNPSEWLRRSAPRLGDETVESAVLRLWHRVPRYINAEADPIPLRLYGRVPSVESLVRMQGIAMDPRLVIKGLRSAGLIRSAGRGRYLPCADTATIGHLHPISVEHVAKSVMRMLGTVLRNTDKRRSRSPLLERSARVPDLDLASAREFAKFTRRQGLAYLQAVDDWLEARRVNAKKGGSGSRKRSIGAGVHLYAYMGNDSDDIASLDLAERAAESSRRSSSAARSGSKRAVALCRTSGIAA